MNPSELCPEGREKLAEWKAWHERAFAVQLTQYDNQRREAYWRYLEHVDKCDICRKEE